MSVLSQCEADAFTRADSTTTMGSTPDGRAWTPLWIEPTTDLVVGINSNHAYSTTNSAGGRVVIDLENAEHDVKVKPFGFTAGTHFSPNLIFRHSSTDHSHYGLHAYRSGANNHLGLFKYSSTGGGTLVDFWPGSVWTSGTELRARVHGNLVDIYLGGSLVEADVALDSSYATYTRAGFRFEQVTGTTRYYDDWEACPVVTFNHTVGMIRCG